MSPSTRRVTGLLLVIAVLALVATYLIHDTTGANLELAPLFVAAAVAASVVRVFRHRTRHPGR